MGCIRGVIYSKPGPTTYFHKDYILTTVNSSSKSQLTQDVGNYHNWQLSVTDEKVQLHKVPVNYLILCLLLSSADKLTFVNSLDPDQA